MNGKVRMAVIGAGMMGKSHINDIASLDNTELAAVCDANYELATQLAAQAQTHAYSDFRALLDQEQLDAVIIATPHYDHAPISIAALSKGVHVLVEKPIATQVKDAQDMLAAYESAKRQHPNLVFGAVFMQRTYGYWRKIKSIIDGGELGKLIRTTWLITDWFRTQSYYNNGGWRATWKGEGGGVLMNQSPHNIDLYQWFVGMPRRVTGFTALGKYHHIEVEDEVTAYFEHENGMIGHFITSTAESPGTNRLEIVGEGGKLVYEDSKLTFFRNQRSSNDQIKDAPGGFDRVEFEKMDIPYEHHGQPGHRHMIENFANAIVNGEALIAPAADGLNSLTLANAIMLSAFENRTIELPLDAEAFARKMQSLIESSTFTKAT